MRGTHERKAHMYELLDKVIGAHGGMDRWRHYSSLTVSLVTGGGLFPLKGILQDSQSREQTISLHEERGSLQPYGQPDWHTSFTPSRIAIENSAGALVRELPNPRASFDGHSLLTPWNPLQRAYFNGYAMWTYLTTPFLLAMPGFEVEEIDPWVEGEERWRVLRASFPDSIASHSRVQEFFFGGDFLLRRHDYHVDVAGGFAAAQLVSDYMDSSGLKFPSKRRAYFQGPDMKPVRELLAVSIDLRAFRLQ